ncbi:WD40 repeat domain-containing protein [Micromonospora yangpuensis]|uniref:WD40 repeat n=1 Tax=Micromonospora yangpuensis TaxID=683228 RepID=A0A1C6UUF0_9ACTN|nr:WD40 repeat domain-containing protein [Micromonospora yangpuensis]GGM24078.1 repetitive protein [Micromonospora yangpuensis]SCL57675.1 WD40 repeat [Micromonospora yangpuensis]
MRVIDLDEHPGGHAAPVTHVALRPAGDRLATCSYDGTVLVWDTADPTAPVARHRLRHRRLVNAAAWHPTDAGVLATASADKTVAVWRLADDEPPSLLNTLARHTDDVNSVAWLPDGERLVCVSEDGRATLWHAVDGTFLGEVGAHAAHCMAVAASRHGLVATVGEDGLVSVYDLVGSDAPARRTYDVSVEGCAWSRSGKILAVARDDGRVDLLTTQLDLLLSMAVSTSAARTVDWSDDDSCLVVGAYDGSVHVFDVCGQRLRRIDDARVWPRSVAVGRGLIAAGSFATGPHLFDLSTGAELAGPVGVTHGPNALAWTGSELLVGCDSGLVLAVDPQTSATRGRQVTDGPILSLATHRGVTYAGTYAGTVLSWRDTPDGGPVGRVDLRAPVPALCATADGVVAGTYQGDLVAVTDGDDGSVAGDGDGRRVGGGGDPVGAGVGLPHGGSVKSLVALPGGFLSASTDRTVAVGTRTDRRVLWEHGNLVNAVAALGPTVVASASRDHTVKVGRLVRDGSGWRVVERQTLLGPDESVKCVGLLGDPDRPTVLAGSYDFGLYAWTVDWADTSASLRSGRLLAEFRQGLSCIAALDSHRVAVAGWDGTILVVALDGSGEPYVQRAFTVAGLLRQSSAHRRDDPSRTTPAYPSVEHPEERP